MVYQQIVGIPMGTNMLHSQRICFYICYEVDIISNLHKSKQHDFIDIYSPSITLNLITIFPIYIQRIFNWTNQIKYFRQRNFFPWLKVLGSDVHISVYDKRNDFWFPMVNYPWLSGDVPRLPTYDFYISQLVRFARCCTSVLDFHSKNLQFTFRLLTLLCPKSPSARDVVACLPVRLLFKSTKHNEFYPV